jgi:alginate O-acetyltransferase complex protein AlgI
MYISMFPQLIAGPIVRYADIEKQLADRKTDFDKAAQGIFRFTLGLAKKVVIANQAGLLWDEVAKSGKPSSLTAFLGAVGFMLQIYFDFSGYSDMAIGLGKMFGFDLLENFNYPYESASVTEFWRRWHISLGSWFREYVYIPLGGNRKGLPRQVLNLLIVWFLTGLWHGAGWNFIIWGLYFFVLLFIEKLGLLKLLKKCPAFVGRLYTLFAVLISWIIFASDDMSSALSMLASLFGANGFADAAALYYLRSYAVIIIIGAVLSSHLVKRGFEAFAYRIKNEKALFALKTAGSACIYALCLVMIINSSYNPFLYFRF